MYKVGCLEPPAATSGPFLGRRSRRPSRLRIQARREFAFSRAPRSGPEDSSAAPEGVCRRRRRLRRALHCAQNPGPAKTQRAGAQTLARRRGALAHALTQECGQRRPLTPSPRRRPTSCAWRLPPYQPETWQHSAPSKLKSIARHAITGAGSRKSAAPKTR